MNDRFNATLRAFLAAGPSAEAVWEQVARWAEGKAAEGQADPDVALGACTALLQSGRLAPGRAMCAALTNRAIIWRRKGDNARAIEDCDSALRHWPAEPSALQCRAGARLATGNVAGAASDLTQLLKFAPFAPFFFRHRAEAFAAAGDHVRAEADRAFAERFEREPGPEEWPATVRIIGVGVPPDPASGG
ncbi:MAG: hypothetical protein IT556_13105, partial [Acetobacteraceae bacterium]|nr:hypothetical protein [Acetobacteraceae bacterium]